VQLRHDLGAAACLMLPSPGSQLHDARCRLAIVGISLPYPMPDLRLRVLPRLFFCRSSARYFLAPHADPTWRTSVTQTWPADPEATRGITWFSHTVGDKRAQQHAASGCAKEQWTGMMARSVWCTPQMRSDGEHGAADDWELRRTLSITSLSKPLEFCPHQFRPWTCPGLEIQSHASLSC
jgi:hypothetical protein